MEWGQDGCLVGVGAEWVVEPMDGDDEGHGDGVFQIDDWGVE